MYANSFIGTTLNTQASVRQDILPAQYWNHSDTRNAELATSNNQNVANPLILDGIQQTVRGFEDAYLNEGGRMAVYEVADPAQLGTFVPDGEMLDNNGAIGNFSDISGG